MNDYYLYEKIDLDDVIFKKDYEIESEYMKCKLNVYIGKTDKVAYFYIAKNGLKKNIKLDAQYDYKIRFNITKDNTIEALLYVITYNNSKKIYSENIKENNIQKINNIKQATHSQLVVRVSGMGNMCIEDISIFRKKKEECILTNKVQNNNHSDYKNIKQLKIGYILDSFTLSCYKGICNLIKIDIDTYKMDLENEKPDLVLVESAWNGNDGQWFKKIENINKYNNNDLKELVNWCKKRKIPTVFWNKEDPVHYEKFINSAKIFDYVFTTDKNSIYKYKLDLKHNNIYVLPFAANPNIHNPIKIDKKRKKESCFAGSYYNNKYLYRKQNLENILKLAIKHTGLEIFDRNYNVGNTAYKFPIEFKPYIKGYLPVDELHKINKGYNITLNVNTVLDSPTMFSRRVFESLACATPVISSYSLGINKMFSNIVVSSDDTEILEKEFINLKEKEYYEAKVVKGIRLVLSKHTYFHRLRYILEKVGINVHYNKNKVAVICKIENLDSLNYIKDIYECQSYKNKILYILTESSFIQKHIESIYKDIVTIYIGESEKYINKHINGDYIAFFNSNNFYGMYYLEDMINATLYSDSDFIGKKTYLTFGKDNNLKEINTNIEYQYTNVIDLDKCIVKKEVIKEMTLSGLLKHIKGNKIDNPQYRYFSIDKYNFVENIKKDLINDCSYIEI